ncbi:MAG: 2-oxo acid dehydrogenase subunit E2 [Anaerotruncus sp.]|nr:MAG: 2-oxo acid dehydrogenase subunit E2 [Anaerotruncus sp.]
MCTLLEIIPPQTTAFAVNAVQDKPIVVKDENGEKHIEIRQILPITVAIDHRALDYGDCIPFFKKLDEIFKNPKILHSWMGNASGESAPTEKGNLHLVDNAD